MSVSIRPADGTDLPVIELLLSGAGLTTAGVADHLGRFLVAEDSDHLIACAGMELYGSSALLRSVAVRADYRNRGLARTLVTSLLERAREDRVARVYLLTTTAADYFQRYGFTSISRDEMDARVLASKEFGDECCASAQAMCLVMGTRREAGAVR